MYKHFEFDTDYCQFYIESKDPIGSSGSPDFWTQQAYDERLALEEGIIGVGTQGRSVKGDVVLLDSENLNVDYAKYDHIVEGTIYVRSEELFFIDCPYGDVQFKLNIAPGRYMVRVYSSNLDTVIDRLLANNTDEEYYHIEIWPSEKMGRKVLKQYESKI